MANNGPILLIEDDMEDQEITRQMIRELGVSNEVIAVLNCDDAYQYLTAHADIQPFIILSDVNLPKINGVDFKEKIDKNEMLKRKSIPFVFYSTSADKASLNKAYEHRVQGYFLKEPSLEKMKADLKLIFDYWAKCRHPNNYQ